MIRYLAICGLVLLAGCERHDEQNTKADDWGIATATLPPGTGVNAEVLPRSYIWKINKTTGDLYFCIYQDDGFFDGKPHPAWLQCTQEEKPK